MTLPLYRTGQIAVMTVRTEAEMAELKHKLAGLREQWEAEKLGISRPVFTAAIKDLAPDLTLPDLVIPGRENKFQLTPDKIGVYTGKCAELCGVDHARMLFNVKVVEKPEYDAYIADLKARGQSGLLDTGMSTDHGQMPDERTT